MKEQLEKQERKTLVININLTRGLVALLTLALLVAAFLGYLVWGHQEATAAGDQAPQAPTAGSTGLRQYYITKDGNYGSGASTACASGYHMASLWEILDPSHLEYNTTLGYAFDDSGKGPPTGVVSWVRTGYAANTDGVAGQANCNAWTSASGSHVGTHAYLPDEWTAGAEDIHVWEVTLSVWTCSAYLRVWCVED